MGGGDRQGRRRGPNRQTLEVSQALSYTAVIGMAIPRGRGRRRIDGGARPAMMRRHNHVPLHSFETRACNAGQALGTGSRQRGDVIAVHALDQGTVDVALPQPGALQLGVQIVSRTRACTRRQGPARTGPAGRLRPAPLHGGNQRAGVLQSRRRERKVADSRRRPHVSGGTPLRELPRPWGAPILLSSLI